MLSEKNHRVSALLIAFSTSVFLHFLVFALLFISQNNLKPYAKAQEESEIALVEYPFHRQIVSQKIFNQVKPKQNSYLSEKNSAVEKQTQAMLRELFPAEEKTNVAKSNISKSNVATKAIKGDSGGPKRAISSEQNTQADDNKLLPTFVLNKIEEPIQGDISEMNQVALPTTPETNRLGRSMDFLPGVQLGSHTLLNTNEFQYYSYFSRMKERLYWEWVRNLREPTNFVSFQILKTKQPTLFSTSIYVYLSNTGEIQDIRVEKSSGVEDIDTIALHAFLSAAPFPNPPKQLIEEDGHIHIRQRFHLYINPAAFQDLALRQKNKPAFFN